MNDPFFTGVCTALVTPFLNNEINYPMLEVLLRRQIDAGIPAIVLCGTTGEAPTLSDQEKLELFRRGKEIAKDRCKIIAGTGSNCTDHALRLSKDAQEAGADALLVVTPYYNKATEQGLIDHYIAIAEAVSIPIILYNVPGRTGLDIPVSVCKTLSGVKNIIGIKEASTDITKITKLRAACGENFSVWTGNDDLTVPAVSLGAQGVISVASNLLPHEYRAMAAAALACDMEAASALQTHLQPLNALLFCEVNPVPIKAAMQLIGYDCGKCRPPLGELSAENLVKLQSFLK